MITGDHKELQPERGLLKEKVARGVAWSIAEKVGTMLLQMAVSLIILNLLTPKDFGVMAILTAFSVFALVFVDSGFSQMLLRKTSPAPEDYKSVFVFNVTVSVVLYALLVAAAPFVARYYDMPVLAKVAPVFFLLLFVNALCVIQNTIFTRQFRFALLSKATFAASLISGLAAIGFALAGFGIWSLVIQRLLQMGVRGAILWWASDWRPSAAYDGRTLRAMAPYSLSLMLTELISAVYNKIPQLFIGKLYAGQMLGYFDQAQKLKDMPVTSTMSAVQGVTFPALSKIVDDQERFAESYRQVVMVVVYAMFPMMVGMSAVSYDLFDALLAEKWMPTAPYFEVICLAGLFYPVTMIAYNVLKVKCEGRTIVRLEVIKKIVMTLILAVTIPRGVLAVVWGLVLIAFCEMLVNFVATTRVTTLSAWRLFRTLLPVVLITAAMYGVVKITGATIPGNALLRLFFEVAAGVVAYVGLSAAFGLEAFREVTGMLRKQLRGR